MATSTIGSARELCANAAEVDDSSQKVSAVIDSEWSKAKRAGYSYQQFKQIMSIPKLKALSKEGYTQKESRIAMTTKQKAVVDEAKKYLGVPYVWGGSSPAGFDCSGLVQYVYKHAQGVNIDLPRTTDGQQNVGKAVSLNDLKPGDLLFWQEGSQPAYHSAIYIGDGEYIHAPTTGQVVCIQKIQYWAPTFARRVLPEETSISHAYEHKEDVKVSSNSSVIWGDRNLTEKRGNTSEYYNKIVHAQRFYIIDGEYYYSLYKDNGDWIGYVNESALTHQDSPNDEKMSVISDNQPIYRNLNLTETKGTTQSYYKKRVIAKRFYQIDDKLYYSIYDYDNNWIGYVPETALDHISTEITEKVKVKGQADKLYNNLSRTEIRGTTSSYYNQQVISKRFYTINGERYYSLYEDDGKWIGYANEKSIEHIAYPHDEDLRVNVKDQPIYDDCSLISTKGTTTSYYNKVLKAKRYYILNDKVYYSLFTDNDDWVGYIEDKNLAHISKEHKEDAKIKNDAAGDLYNDLSLSEVRGKIENYAGKKVQIRRYYVINNKRYYSIYQDDNKWIGYIEESFIEHTPIKHVENIKITSNNEPIYKDTNLENPVGTTNKYYNQTVEARRFYIFNDEVYYSTYTKSGDWIGYIREGAVDHQPIAKVCDVVVSKANGDIYRNQSLTAKKGKTDDYLNKVVHIQRYYNINGSKYYSVYDNNDKWIGYIKDEYLTLK